MPKHYAGPEYKCRRGQSGGYASLGADGKVPASQLPSGGGTGDMTKAIYDPNADGIIALAQLDSGVCSETEADSKITSHKGDASAHHIKYTNTEAVAAAKADSDIADAITKKHANTNDPTAGEKAALAGTSGTPSGTNKFVTNSDPRNSDARAPTAHNQDASTINTGTLDGDRLPVISTTKKGGVPATGTPSGKYLKDDGTWATPAGGGGGPSTVKKTSDQTFSNSTLANITELVFALTAGVYYQFKFVVLFQSNTATVGIKLGLTCPTYTRFGATARIPIAADGAACELQGAINTSGDSVMGTAVAVINVDFVAVVEGVILPSANGNLQLQAANETGTTPVIVRQASMGALLAIP